MSFDSSTSFCGTAVALIDHVGILQQRISTTAIPSLYLARSPSLALSLTLSTAPSSSHVAVRRYFASRFPSPPNSCQQARLIDSGAKRDKAANCCKRDLSHAELTRGKHKHRNLRKSFVFLYTGVRRKNGSSGTLDITITTFIFQRRARAQSQQREAKWLH